MSKITALRIGKGQRNRVNTFLDNRFFCKLEKDVVLKEGLQVGQELTPSQIEALTKSNDFYSCFNAAIHYLGYRPRSEFEIKERLLRRGFGNETVESVIVKLKEQGLVDDVAFAQFWRENRDSFSPRSQWLTKLELRQKRVNDDVIDQVIETSNDEDSAYRAALTKARSLPRSDYQSFRQRLGEFLKRRGFDYRTINHAIERLWSEGGLEPNSPP